MTLHHDSDASAGNIAMNAGGAHCLKYGVMTNNRLDTTMVMSDGEVIPFGDPHLDAQGYELLGLICGSEGQLGITTEAMSPAALASPHEITGAAYLPREPSCTLQHVEGFAGQVDYRLGRLRQMYASTSFHTVEGDGHGEVWRIVRDGERFAGGRNPVLRLSVRPENAPVICNALQAELAAEVFLDCGSGLIRVRLPECETASAEAVRRIVAATGGHATLVRAAEPVRASVPVFQPRSRRIASLSEALRAKSDPDRILNPARMAA